MHLLWIILIFILILFLYIHIQEQYKKSEDLEVYEMDYTSNEHLQRVCAMKQPILFQFGLSDEVIENINEIGIENNYESTPELEMWDIRDYEKKPESVLLSYGSFANFTKSDPKGVYFTYKNQDWLEETGGVEHLRIFDEFWKPPLAANSSYELWMGSAKAHTPLQYHMNDHLYLYVTKGKMSVKMTPWRSRKYFDCVKDFENYEFYSKMDPWTTNGTANAVKWLDFEVVEGYALYIPAWWWFSIRFSAADTRVVGIKYQTVGNICAHLPNWMQYYFQYHTTKHIVTKTLELSFEEAAAADKEQTSI
jgi:hypothetical protein